MGTTPQGKVIDATYLKTQLKNFDTVVLGGKYQTTIQVQSLPAAAASLNGAIYQYTGETTASYTNGYFYKCDGTTWSPVLTQAEVAEYTIVKADTADTGMSATYQLYKGDTAVGDKINIPKDWLLKNVTIKTCSTVNVPEEGYQVGDKYFDFEFNTNDTTTGSETTKHTYLKVNELVNTYTGGNGITVSSDNIISVDLNSVSGLEMAGTSSDKLTVKAGDGIEVAATGVKVKADAAGPIAVAAAGVNINLDSSLKVNTSKNLAVDFESTNIDFANEWT